MSDKSIGQNDAQAKSDDEISSSNYSRSNHLIQQSPPKNVLTTNPPNDIMRRRPENDEPWTLPFASPGFPQFQMPLGFQQMTNLPAFSLTTKMDNLFDEFSDNHQQMDQRWQNNPFQKVLGPLDMLPIHDQVNQEDNINVNFSSQGTQNQQIKSQAPSIQQQQQYTQNLQQQQQLLRFPYQMQQQIQQQMQQQMQQQLQQQMQQQQQNPMIKNSPQPFQNLMYNQQMLPQQLQQYKQYQQQYMPQVHPQPFVNNQYIPNQREQESQQYQNINAVSKELLTKVYMIVQHTSVSSFQCNCKKSKCLKLYCECFANGQVCSQSCNCLDCKNRIDNPQERQKAIEEALTRNNDAFNNILNVKNQGQYPLGQASQIAPQLNSIELPSQFNSSKNLNFLVSQIKGDKPPQGKGSLQNRLRRGCNCKKSNCKKKYCECFSAGLSCNELCKCDNCYNKKGLTTSEQEKNNPQELKQISNDYLKDIKEEGRDLQMVEGEEQQIYSSKKINFKSKKIKKEEIEQSGSDNKIQIKKDIWNKPKKSQQLAQ